jgi:MFS family permease
MMIALYAFTFFHGVFAAGLIPILGSLLPGHTAWAFGAYFVGLVLGQLIVVAWASLRARPRAYAACEAAFGASLVGMGATLAWVPWNLVAGRLVEGLAAGMSLPLLFELVAHGGASARTPRRLAVFNSLFVVGFVVGPPLVEALLRATSAGWLLALAGGACAVLALGMWTLLPARTVGGANAGAAPATGTWWATFYLIFLAKCVYGFVLPYTADHLAPALAPLTLAQIMLLISGAVVVGQAAAVPLAGRLPAFVYPTALAALLVGIRVTSVAWLLFPAAVVHALVLHAGLTSAAARPGGARDFAIVNSLSDPGMVLGSALAAVGPPGLVGLAALSVLPLARKVAS